jgi:FKBP-type peptidyl-prolyl cis-trans isomerase SlyD
MQIKRNTVVTIDYTLHDNDGSLIESSEGRDPYSYIHGIGATIPGLEAALEGKGTGEELTVSLPPDQAYGERDEELVQVVPRERFKFGGDLAAGMQFHASTDTGTRVVTVTRIDGEEVTVDGNHPLAGSTLTFAVTVREVREASAEELEHGHVHGAGAHGHEE